MKKRVVDLRTQVPLLDIANFGRGGGRVLTPALREHIALTVGRAPEVMIKVSGGSRNLTGVGRHFDYIGRQGKLAVELDTGDQVRARGLVKFLEGDWDLDLEAHEGPSARSVRGPRKPMKLVHNIIFSMPAGTPPEKVLRAVRAFATEEFALKQRYAMVMHTDEPHPHVHMVVKAVSERGVRLNIRKATLRHWRQRFATRLREQGVAANATERAVRGQVKSPMRSSSFRAMQRDASNRYFQRARSVYTELESRGLPPEKSSSQLIETRRNVLRDWESVHDILFREGQDDLAGKVRRFIDRMPAPRTDKERIAAALRLRDAQSRNLKDSLTR